MSDGQISIILIYVEFQTVENLLDDQKLSISLLAKYKLF